MRVISPAPPEFSAVLLNLGPSRLVIVEGPDDREVFVMWYQDRLSQIQGIHPDIQEIVERRILA